MMKINLVDFFNRYIRLENQIIDILNKIDNDDYNSDNYDELLDEIRNIDITLTEDTAAKIICNYIERIAIRALKLNDKEILSCLEALMVVGEEEEEEQ